jgi:hypothetical protein
MLLFSPSTQPEPATATSSPLSSLFGAGRQRNGKIARLAKPVRDRINNMLLDGKAYLDIIASLGPDGQGLNEDNVGNWKAGGYQDWLREQRQIEILRSKQEFAMDLVRDTAPHKVHQAILQIAAANLCQLLLELDPNSLRELIEKEPDKYTRLLNAIVRLSDGQIKAERFTAEVSEKRASLAREKAPAEPGGISEEALQAAEARLKLL